MAKNLSEGREALYQMICSLKSEDIHKVVSYVSFLRFVDVYKDKAMADLLRIEIAKGNQDELEGSYHPQDSLHSQDSYHSQDSIHSQDSFHPADSYTGSYMNDSDEIPASESPDMELVYETKYDKDYSDEKYARHDRYGIYDKETPVGETFLNEEPELAYDISAKESYVEAVNEVALTEEAPPEAEKIEEPAAPAPPPDQHASVQKLRWVARCLNLNFADVGFLFNISPTMARMRYMGTELLSAEEEMQLHFFVDVTQRVEKMLISRFDQMLRYPMPDGEFFLEKLKDRKITDECLTILQKTAENFDELRRKFKGAAKPFHAMQDAIGTYATPLHCEG